MDIDHHGRGELVGVAVGMVRQRLFGLPAPARRRALLGVHEMHQLRTESVLPLCRTGCGAAWDVRQPFARMGRFVGPGAGLSGTGLSGIGLRGICLSGIGLGGIGARKGRFVGPGAVQYSRSADPPPRGTRTQTRPSRARRTAARSRRPAGPPAARSMSRRPDRAATARPDRRIARPVYK